MKAFFLSPLPHAHPLLPVLIIMLALSACRENKDPFREVAFGQVSYQAFVNEMTQKGLFTDYDSAQEDYRFYLPVGEDSIPVVAKPNSDGYPFGRLLGLTLNLNGDTAKNHPSRHLWFYSRGSGARKAGDLKKVLETFQSWYGKPDSAWTEYALTSMSRFNLDPLVYENYPDLDFNQFRVLALTGKIDIPSGWIKHDSSRETGKFAYWDKGKYQVSVYLPPDDEGNLVGYPEYEDFRRGAEVKYKVKNYGQEVAEVRDSIRSSYSPSEVFLVQMYSPSLSRNRNPTNPNLDRKIYVSIDGFKHIGKEEPRAVSSCKFDIFVTDQFGEELFVMPDQILELPKPIAYSPPGGYQSFLKNPSYGYQYDSRHPNNSRLERARMDSRVKLKAKARIKSVIFEDGTVLSE